jgi:hypothetical protein
MRGPPSPTTVARNSESFMRPESDVGLEGNPLISQNAGTA